LEENPLLILGFGINAYFSMIKQMLFMMFFVCLANLPLFYIYGQGNAHSDNALAALSLGNMGGSLSICS